MTEIKLFVLKKSNTALALKKYEHPRTLSHTKQDPQSAPWGTCRPNKGRKKTAYYSPRWRTNGAYRWGLQAPSLLHHHMRVSEPCNTLYSCMQGLVAHLLPGPHPGPTTGGHTGAPWSWVPACGRPPRCLPARPSSARVRRARRKCCRDSSG